MRKQSLLLLVALAPFCARAQSDDDNKPSSPPVENLYFATDEFVYIPKYTFTFGTRFLGGAHSSFSGTGRVYSPYVFVGDSLTDTLNRYYYDGTVYQNTRTDGNGKLGTTDGMTNYWSYSYASQADVVYGYIAMHTYEASVLNDGVRHRDMSNLEGVEAQVQRDLFKIGRVAVSLTGGISLNDMTVGYLTMQNATVKTITDYYSLNGATAPKVGSYPGSNTVNSYDPWGNLLYTDPPSNTAVDTQTITNSPLISQTPVARSTTYSNWQVKNYYHLKGSFYTIRLGPTFSVPFTAKLRFTVSAGPAMLYASGTFTVDSQLSPDITLSTASDSTESITTITNDYTSVDKKILPAWYVDANLEYWMTERTGFYLGMVHQESGTYTQKIYDVNDADYTARIDLGSLSGYRMGMNYRF